MKGVSVFKKGLDLTGQLKYRNTELFRVFPSLTGTDVRLC